MMRGQGGRRGTRRVLCTPLLGALATALLALPAAAQAQIAVSDAQATESGGAMTFSIVRQAGLLAPAVSVAFATVDGSASSPADYGAASGTRTFPGTLFGATQVQTVTIDVRNDALDEPDETFRLAVSGDGVTDGEGQGTIFDDDPPPSVAAVDAPPAAEGGVATFKVVLSRASGRTVSVAFATADGSAVAGQDYVARSGTATIAPGTTSASIGVNLLDDGADEPNESFELRLSAPNGATLGDASAGATIVDDDEPAASGPPPATAPSSSAPQTAPGGGAGGGGTTSTSLPQLGISSPRLRLPATVLVTISCPRQAGRCSGRLTLFSRPNKRSKLKALRVERRLGRRTFALAGGTTRTLQILLSRRDRVLLKRAGRIDVRAYVLTTDAAGRTGVRRVNGTLIGRTRHG